MPKRMGMYGSVSWSTLQIAKRSTNYMTRPNTRSLWLLCPSVMMQHRSAAMIRAKTFDSLIDNDGRDTSPTYLGTTYTEAMLTIASLNVQGRTPKAATPLVQAVIDHIKTDGSLVIAIQGCNKNNQEAICRAMKASGLSAYRFEELSLRQEYELLIHQHPYRQERLHHLSTNGPRTRSITISP